MATKARNYCWTANNYNGKTFVMLESIAECEWVRYLCYGKEIAPTTGTPHLQGYIQLNKATTVGWITKKMPGCHMIITRGSAEDNITYCKKNKPLKDFTEYGIPKITKKEGIKNIYGDIRKMAAAGVSYDIIADKHPGIALRYSRALHEWVDTQSRKEVETKLQTVYDAMELRPWQKEIIEKLKEQDDRKVLWMYDKIGKTGKTWLCQYIAHMMKGFYVSSGKMSDIAHAWGLQKTVVFNLTREKEQTVNYGGMEAFKDGAFFSPKYDSKTKIIPGFCRVLVAANWEPQYRLMSVDRWMVVEISKKDDQSGYKLDWYDDVKIQQKFDINKRAHRFD